MSKPCLYTFKLLGKDDGMFVLRAPTWNTENRGPMAAHWLENRVMDWLFENANGRYHIGSANVKGYPTVPALANGNSLCVLLSDRADVQNFANEFPVRDLHKLSLL
jgi:hypothetical protein